jgi:hypothetical protein
MTNGQGGRHSIIKCTTLHLSGVQVGGFVKGEDEEGVEDCDGMKDRLGGKRNFGTQLSLEQLQQLQQRVSFLIDNVCLGQMRSTWERTTSISH